VKQLRQSSPEGLGEKLIRFFNERFGSVSLPSHNLEHHLRVLAHAMGIAGHLRNAGFCFSDDFIAGLQIACMTHVIGMALDNSHSHGKAGMEMAAEFMAGMEIPADLREEILGAVENHDRNDYSVSSPPDSMLTILSVADDLDAFGYIGIYRYIEIYLKRGVDPEKISDMVRPNLTSRYQHMTRVYGFLPGFIGRHTPRYETASDFFNPEGPFSYALRKRVMKITEDEMKNKHADIPSISARYRNEEEAEVASFFNKLHRELMMAEFLL
jgi:HD superfamily phosphodiesterase